MTTARSVWSRSALVNGFWQQNVLIDIDNKGRVAGVSANETPRGEQVELLLPAMPNLHSHAFQRAMAGMTETRGSDPSDSFWSWRKLMYQFLQHLNPDDIESIAAFGQIEMLEAGFGAVGEFHYLHHQADGKKYDNLAEMSERIVAAAMQSGIGMTLLPVLYEHGGCDGRELQGGQKRFGNSIDQFSQLYTAVENIIKPHSDSFSVGIAPHSLRAVSQSSLAQAEALLAGKPLHIHVAEQTAEVDEIQAAWNARPVEWLLDNHNVTSNWCLVHATQMNAEETRRVARTGAVVGLCPITESNLGDGIFNGVEYRAHSGHWGIGTDSNVRISLSEELRTLEYSQRLKHRKRAIYATEAHSTGRVLYDSAMQGGSVALNRQCGSIAIGEMADLIALDIDSPSFVAVDKDNWLDAWLFANDDSVVTDVWVAGRHLVKEGVHVHREEIERRYRNTLKNLIARL